MSLHMIQSASTGFKHCSAVPNTQVCKHIIHGTQLKVCHRHNLSRSSDRTGCVIVSHLVTQSTSPTCIQSSNSTATHWSPTTSRTSLVCTSQSLCSWSAFGIMGGGIMNWVVTLSYGCICSRQWWVNGWLFHLFAYWIVCSIPRRISSCSWVWTTISSGCRAACASW